MNEENKQEIIELYLLGELEPDVLQEFEAQLATDTRLQQRVELAKDLQDALDDAQEEVLFSEKLSILNDKYLEEGNTQPKKEQTPKSNQRRNIIGITLLITSIMVSYFIWQQLNTPKTIAPDEVFASYYEPYSSNKLARGGDNADEAYLNAIEAYDNKNYSAAITSLAQRVAAKPKEIPTQLLLGNSYLNVSPPETAKAITLFKNIAEGETIYTTSANWYLALAYLQNNQSEAAKVIFENLSENASGEFANLAKQILSEWK